MNPPPRLARGVTITRRQIGEDEIYYLVKDPRSGTFLRIGEVEAAVLRLLDGSRSLSEAAEALDLAHGFRVGAPAIEAFVATLTKRGIVESRAFDPRAFREEWLQQQRARRRSLGKFLSNLAYLKVHLLNPHPLFQRMAGPLGFFWSRSFVVSTLALMATAAVMAARHHEEIFASSRAFYFTATSSAGSFVSHLLILYIVGFFVVAVHELAHGLTCTHFGGKVTDMGFILFYLQVPGFYCDITDAYSFERRGARLWTTFAGSYTGLLLASIGVVTWWTSQPGDLINDVAIVLMFLGGPPALAFNWNPLLKLDGYYILMDLLEAPNLMANSFRYLGYLFKTRLLRVPAEPVAVPPRLRRAYVIYGTLALLFIAPWILSLPFIAYFIFAGLFGVLALPLAAAVAWRALMKPALKAAATLRYAWLSHRAALLGGELGRARLALMGGGSAVALALALFGPRVAVRAQATGPLEPMERVEVRASRTGFAVWPASGPPPREGDEVRAGELLIRLENPDLEAARRGAALELEAARFDRARLEAAGDPATAAERRSQERALADRERLLAHQIEELELRAPIGGVVLTPRLEDRLGAYLKQGETWCVIGSAGRLRVRVPLSERDLGVIGERSEADVKAISLPAEVFRGRVSRLPAGRRPAPPPPADAPRAAPLTASAAPGGPLEALVAGSLEVEVEVDNPERLLRPGMTARVRIYGERLTLAGHAARWAHRLFKGKVWW